MAIDFSKINLEVIDINTNADPDIYINQNGITFSKRVLEDLNYPQNVQYGFDPAQHVFAIKVCKSNEARATAFSKPRSEQTTTLGAAVGLMAFALQIYFDFSGYSEMAIGIGRCLGFHFKENFDHPYCCTSITDFWRRWHISLGSFFRDYVYIPMGGNRRHQALNILVVWFLTGLWHGASWNFVIWGMYFGIIVALEKFTIVKLEKYRWLHPLLHIYSLLIVLLGWGVFYFDDFDKMLLFFRQLFTAGGGMDFLTQSLVMNKLWLWLVAIICCLPIRKWLQQGVRSETVRLLTRIVVSTVILATSIALLVGATNNPFLYTRF